MVKANLVSMSVEGLLQLHDDIGNILSQKASQLQSQLAALGNGGLAPAAANSGGRRRTSKMKGRKVAPKYRKATSCRNTGDFIGISDLADIPWMGTCDLAGGPCSWNRDPIGMQQLIGGGFPSGDWAIRL